MKALEMTENELLRLCFGLRGSRYLVIVDLGLKEDIFAMDLVNLIL